MAPEKQQPSVIDKALATVNLMNTAAASIASLLILIRGSDPRKTIGEVLKEAEDKFGLNIAQVDAWMKAHGYQ
jgi:hypothetical protein